MEVTNTHTIWKFLLSPIDDQIIQMPTGAFVISAGMQEDQLMVWAIVNPEASKQGVRFKVYGTGDSMSNPQTNKEQFIATVFSGPFAWHVFEVTK